MYIATLWFVYHVNAASPREMVSVVLIYVAPSIPPCNLKVDPICNITACTRDIFRLSTC